ncbi:MAG: OmpA family protein [Pseudomonadota bacterium]
MSSTNENETLVSFTKRYWKRVDEPQSWFPAAALPLLVLVGLLLIGGTWSVAAIERDVAEQVADRLVAAGISSSKVTADGQSVHIVASASAVSAVVIRAVALATECATWAGGLPCVADVEVNLREAGGTAERHPRPHSLTVSRRDGGFTLLGEVPSNEEHDRILAKAQQRASSVVNRMAVTGEPATDEFAGSVDVAIDIAAKLRQGKAVWSGQRLAVVGVSSPADFEAVRKRFADIDDGTRGEFDLRVVETPEACNQVFRGLLSKNDIRFRTGSAEVDASSHDLLERIARASESCPGTLNVEGHTDDRGDADMNQQLSFERASSVRFELGRLGVDVSRITAVGFGEERPIADNATAAGRAKNRRITVVIADEG